MLVGQAGTGKNYTLEQVARTLNKEQEKTICFGDERNDVSMLKVAGLGVACANANQDLKDIADIITDSCDDDGVAKALIKYGV